jgi:Cu-Zn family superoxide dismutase
MLLSVTAFSAQLGADGMKPSQAIAVLHPTDGSHVKGTVTFAQTAEGMKIITDLEGLTSGRHGFHIHQWGDCSAPDGTSAGGHYNPFAMSHGGPSDAIRHLGDLGNITARDEGKVHEERLEKDMTLDGPGGIIGRSVIVHAGEDDQKSQPTGNAGGRLACGVIGYQKSE